MTWFVELLIVLFLIYISTQWFLPFIYPEQFEYNFLLKSLFKKKADRVEKLKQTKSLWQIEVEEAQKELKEKQEKITKAQDELKSL